MVVDRRFPVAAGGSLIGVARLRAPDLLDDGDLSGAVVGSSASRSEGDKSLAHVGQIVALAVTIAC